MQKGVSKWNSIAYLQKRLGYGNFEIIAFGDDFNDTEMLQNAHQGIAMGNGEENLKAIAHAVAKTNDEDGVSGYLERMLISEGIL